MIEYKVEVYPSGTKKWFVHEVLHREDGPACEYFNGEKSWWINGKRHREEGPAVEYADGTKSWYLNDERLTEAEFLSRTTKHKITIDGKTVEIDHETFRKLKELLG